MVSYNEVAPISKQMTIVTGLSVVGLMAFGLAVSYYKNVLFDRQLDLMKQRNAALQQEIAEGHANLQYLQSRQYKDKYAKENFGLLQPGEKVLFVPKADPTRTLTSSSELTPEEKQAIYEENLRNIRVIDHWKLFLFHHDTLENLKKDL